MLGYAPDSGAPMTLGNMRANGVARSSSIAGRATTKRCRAATAGPTIFRCRSSPRNSLHLLRDDVPNCRRRLPGWSVTPGALPPRTIGHFSTLWLIGPKVQSTRAPRELRLAKRAAQQMSRERRSAIPRRPGVVDQPRGGARSFRVRQYTE